MKTVQLSLFEPAGSVPKIECIKPALEVLPKWNIDQLMKKGAGRFSRDEAKILMAGFCLVKYKRDTKSVFASCTDPMLGWYLMETYQTYAAAERRLKEISTGDNVIETGDTGTVSNHTSTFRLTAAGFEFYRSEGIIPGHGTPRIKQFSKNWGTWKKFDTCPQCKRAWDELMKDPKALEG